MSNKIRLGIIALGEHCIRAHLKHLVLDPRVEIVAIFDPKMNREKMAAVVASLGLETALLETESVFWQQDMQAVIIASPDEFHAQQLYTAVQKGLHVFCEKPMAVSMQDLQLLNQSLAMASQQNLIISSCHPRRFDPPLLWLKEQISSGVLEQSIGEVLHFDFSFWYRQVEDTPEYAWKKNRSLLSDHFGHEIDCLAFLFPHHCQAIQAKKWIDSYHHYEVSGQADNGFSLRFVGLRSRQEIEYDEALRIDGRKGSWLMSLSRGQCFMLPRAQTVACPKIDYDVRFKAVNANFIDAITGAAQNYLTHEDILRNNTMSVQLDKQGLSLWSTNASWMI